MSETFLDPPREARPWAYWVWLNGLTDRERLVHEITEVKQKGMSGLLILEIGARGGDPIPAGPAYFGPESLDTIAFAVREATRQGLWLGITTASSWNSGGSWVTPEHASKGLYFSQTDIEGGQPFEGTLPFPRVPQAAPRDEAGRPRYWYTVAVLGVPANEPLAGHEIILELAPPTPARIHRAVFYNAKAESYSKDFTILISTNGTKAADFREVRTGSLEARDGAQPFEFPASEARYVKLLIRNGHGDPSARVGLAEIELYNEADKNLAYAKAADGSRTAGRLWSSSSEYGLDQEWLAESLIDGRKEGANGSWASAGPVPLLIRDPSKIVNLAQHLRPDGRLKWTPASGRWRIYWFICANNGEMLKIPSPRSRGLIIDHFSKEATEFHMRYMVDKLHTVIPRFEGSALRYLYACSYEVRGSMWTGALSNDFRTRRGYRIEPFLPIAAGCTVENESRTHRFMVDWRTTMAEEVALNYYGTLRKIADQSGLLAVAEAGGPAYPIHRVPVDALQAQGQLDIPRGEFWKEYSIWVVKETASAAHLYGQPIVEMEAFTSYRHWQDGPRDLKGIADRAFCDGANRFCFHTMPHRPKAGGSPGWAYYAGTHVGPGETWWPFARPFVDYLARVSHMLQQGRFVADVLFYYGEEGFNFVQEDARKRQPHPDLGRGYDCDYTNTDALLHRVNVHNGRIVLPDGLSYALLSIPPRATLNAAASRKIDELENQGAKIVESKAVNTTLRTLGIAPDFTGEGLEYIHRRLPESDVYFVTNPTQKWTTAECSFRAQGSVVEIWDPIRGTTARAPKAAVNGGRISLPLTLAPWGSCFVVVSNAPSPKLAKLALSEPVPRSAKALNGPWTVRFTPGWGAPDSIQLETLTSWTEHPDDGVRHYSGSATYHTRFRVDSALGAGRSAYLDLGDVQVIAQVRVNGRDAGGVWCFPFRVEVGTLLRQGDNDLEVEVANLWSNRLTGDARGREKRYTNTNLPWKPSTPLLASGLLGPVVLFEA